ncbi:MAG: alpha/beta family hydrolase [Alphaproteobacteria bacterium]
MLIDGPDHPHARFLFAHGAGAPMDTAFMDAVARGLSANDIQVLRFEFPYMAKRRADGKRRGPDRMPVLLETWRTTIAGLPPRDVPTLIGGKSMGGRAAATFAAAPEGAGSIDGVICMGYPFHPPAKPEKTRLEPLRGARQPTLIVQGERDRFGNREDVGVYELKPPVEIVWISDGDHSFVPRKSSGRTEQENIEDAVRHVTAFIEHMI